MEGQYQVVGPCAHATVDGPHGRKRQLHFKGKLLPPDVPAHEIQHLLSVGLVKEVGVPASAPAPAVPPAVSTTVDGPTPAEAEAGDGEPGDTDSPDGEQVDDPDTPDADQEPETGQQPDTDPEVEAKRVEARAKLPADGSKPDGRAGQPVWVEYLVNQGYDYTALAKEDKKTLVELASQP